MRPVRPAGRVAVFSPPCPCSVHPAEPADADAVWAIFHAVVSGGDTYAYAPDTPRAAALRSWTESPAQAYVAREHGDGPVVATFTLRPNQPGRGAHVANAGFMVDPACAGRGIGRALGEHALDEARRQGFLAMQFNYVVSTNGRAVALWRSLGFAVVGTVPGAFRPRDGTLTDVHVMHRWL